MPLIPDFVVVEDFWLGCCWRRADAEAFFMQDFTMVVERTAAAAARRLLVFSEGEVALVMREDGILFLLSMLI